MSHIEDRWKIEPDRQGKGKRWRVRYRTPAHEQRSASFHLLKDAQRFCREIDNQLSSGNWIDPNLGQEDFEQFARQWLNGRRDLAPKTFDLYSNLLRHHLIPHLQNVPIANISLNRADELIHTLQKNAVGQNTVRKAGTLLRQIHQASVEEGLIATNRLQNLRLPKEPKPEARFLTHDDLNFLLQNLKPEALPVVLLGALAGLRIGEVFGLQIADIDVTNNRITIRRQMQELKGKVTFRPPKTASGKRTIAIPEVLSNLLAPLITDRPKDESLFLIENSALMRPSNSRRRVWKPAVEAAELGQVLFMPSAIPVSLGLSKAADTCGSYSNG